jgi:hypothetical protein
VYRRLQRVELHGPAAAQEMLLRRLLRNLTPFSPQTQDCNAEPCAVCAYKKMNTPSTPPCGELVCRLKLY